ncbi:MAG: hypothetical protein U0174_05870 [Polyangiaceae bacterium]
MRTLLILTVSALSLNPCSKEEGGAEPATSATAATAKPAADGPAVNEKNITRYPTERKVDETATTLREFDVRQSPPTGAVVAHIPAGTSVKKIATMPGAALVTFTAPNGEKTMGWLGDQAFEVMPEAPTPNTPNVPIVVNRDAGAGVVKDAGGAPAVVDAGTAPAAATPKRKAVNGKCDPGWVVFPTGSDTCRQTCTSDASCGNPGLKCLPKGSQKLCATPQG